MAADQDRAAKLIDDLIGDHLSNGALVGDPSWDSYAVRVSADDDGLRVSGFTFTDAGPPRRVAIGTIGQTAPYFELRDAAAGPNGEQWDACVFLVQRDSGQATVKFLYGDDAAAVSADDIGESLRPTPADFR